MDVTGTQQGNPPQQASLLALQIHQVNPDADEHRILPLSYA
jgi:hypothetical protein